uniref:Uncharacterized protein n=1 Tax=Romanomermis culicivorax TaxID=13658 RepID=A0A915I8K7_ROMCU
MAESVIPPPKRRPRIAKSSAVPSPQLQDGAGAMEQAAPAPEQSQAFKIYTETAIRNVQKPPQPQQTQRDVERKRNVIEGKDGVHVENVTVQKTNSKKMAAAELPHLVEESVIKPPSKNKISEHSRKKSALFKVYSETFMNKAAEHAPKIFPKSTRKGDSSKILSIPNPMTPPPPPATIRKSVMRSEPVPAGLMDYQTFFVVKENAMKASMRRSVQKKVTEK